MIEMTKESAQKVVKKRDDLLKLQENPIFKEIFIEGYFRDEAARIAQAIVNPEMMDDIDQRELEGQMRSIGHIQNYMLTIRQAGNAMEARIKEAEAEEREAERLANVEVVVDDITGDEIEVSND